jgi:hypothetical protein
MGNRAVITTPAKKVGIYLHWNGGRDSIEAFLKYCELQNFRSPENDCYGWARLSQIISNFFGGSTSIGIDEYYKLDTDNYDNGVYIIKNWEIIGRDFFEGTEQNEYELNEMLKAIDEKQPKHMQLGELLDAEEVKTEDLQIGDEVFIETYSGYEKHKVIGFGEDIIVNGTRVKGMPYVDMYMNNGTYTENPNNYIRTNTIRKVVLKNENINDCKM